MPLKTFLFLFLLITLFASVPAPLTAQDPVSTDPTSVQDDTAEKKKKKKQENEEEFLRLRFEKLSTIFFIRLLIDLVSMFILIRMVYYSNHKKKDFFFTFFMFNIVMFFITYLLNKVDLSTGAAFGLFAVFSLLRYRTEDISAKDMTYLFCVIALGLITAVNKGNLLEICLINGFVILMAFLLDGKLLLRQEMVKIIQYDNIEMIKPGNHETLLEDLKKRTGLNINRIAIGKVDYLRDTALIKIYYYETSTKVTSDY